jgi:hypothetical protein
MWQILNPNPYGYNFPYDSLSPFIGPSNNPYPYLAPAYTPYGQGDWIQTGGQPSAPQGLEMHLKGHKRTAVIVASVIGSIIVLAAAGLLIRRYAKPKQTIDIRAIRR